MLFAEMFDELNSPGKLVLVNHNWLFVVFMIHPNDGHIDAIAASQNEYTAQKDLKV